MPLDVAYRGPAKYGGSTKARGSEWHFYFMTESEVQQLLETSQKRYREHVAQVRQGIYEVKTVPSADRFRVEDALTKVTVRERDRTGL